MKKIYLTLFIGGLVLTSCKKDYSCDCTITETSSQEGSDPYIYNTKSTIKETNKKAIQNQGFCMSTVETNTGEQYVGMNPVTFEPMYETVTTTTTSDCKLSK